MIRLIIIPLVFFLQSCSEHEPPEKTLSNNNPGISSQPEGAKEIPMSHTETFRVFERENYKIVDLKAPLVSWGGSAQGSDQTSRIVLVPHGQKTPPMQGELKDAILVRTPVKRIAVNYGFLEAIVLELGIEDKLVAVGGVKSYDDSIRTKAREDKLAKIGYGWHSPPSIDPLVGSQPDVLFMVMGNLEHTQHMNRINRLGIPVVPIFFEAETHYMGPVDYVRLLGMMTGTEDRAENFVRKVENNVAELKSLVANVPKKKVLSSWYGGNDRWMVTVRNADNALLTDAGGINPLAQSDNIRIDDFVKVGSEFLLEHARDIDCWIIRDSHSQPFTDIKYLSNFKAWRHNCLFAADGSSKPKADAYDIYATGVIRPDLILRDMLQMLHPHLIKAPYTFVQPDTKTPRQ